MAIFRIQGNEFFFFLNIPDRYLYMYIYFFLIIFFK